MRFAAEIFVLLREVSAKCCVCCKCLSLHLVETLHTLLATPVLFPGGCNRFRLPGVSAI